VPTRLKIVVSDSSVVMDLAKGRLIEATLALPYEFVIPDVMLAQELLDLGSYTSTDLLRLGFKLGELDGDGVGDALRQYQDHHRDLSLNDCFALTLAQRLACILMSGDGSLRAIAEGTGLEVHGLLWAAEQILDRATCPVGQLLNGLEVLERDPLVRLPRSRLLEFVARLRQRG
jgi:hypothetical protein